MSAGTRLLTGLLGGLLIVGLPLDASAGLTTGQKCAQARWKAAAQFERRVGQALVKYGPLGRDDREELTRVAGRAFARFDERLQRIEDSLDCPAPFDLPKNMFRVLRSRDVVATNDRIGGGLGSDVLNGLFGDCHDESSLPSIGCARIDDPIAGRPLDVVSAIAGEKLGYQFVFTRLDTTHTAVAISDFPDWCGNYEVLGRTLHMSLFENPSLPFSVVTRPGTFDVWLPDLNGGSDPGTGNVAIVQITENTTEGGTGQLADSGTVTVDEVSSHEISGTFDVTIDGESVAGSFRAPMCAPWTRSGDVPGPGATNG